MFSELVDVLRCPRPHEESWLVLSVHDVENRDIREGVLGCPVCHAEYLIADGVARFADASSEEGRTVATEEAAIRLVALLDLTGAHGYAIIVGELTKHAVEMRGLTDVQLLLVNPPSGMRMGNGLSGLTVDASWPKLPLAAASARGIALDDAITQAQLDAGLEVVATGGRVLAPRTLQLPDGLTELARDDHQWLAERHQAARSSGIVSLLRKR